MSVVNYVQTPVLLTILEEGMPILLMAHQSLKEKLRYIDNYLEGNSVVHTITYNETIFYHVCNLIEKTRPVRYYLMQKLKPMPDCWNDKFQVRLCEIILQLNIIEDELSIIKIDMEITMENEDILPPLIDSIPLSYKKYSF